MGFMLVNLLEHLQKPNVLVAIILAILGVFLALIAKRAARAFRHVKEIKDDDAIMVSMKIVGLLLILVGLILMVVDI